MTAMTVEQLAAVYFNPAVNGKKIVLDLGKIAMMKPLVESFLADIEKHEAAQAAIVAAANAEVIAFSEQTSWEVEGLGTLSLAGLALIATSSLPVGETYTYTAKKTGIEHTVEATPVIHGQQGAVWDTLREIQRGKVAQGKPFALDSKSLRAYFG